MATKFAKGEEVKVVMTVPQGPVQRFRMDDDGNVFYLISWTSDGTIHERWFSEQELVKA